MTTPQRQTLDSKLESAWCDNADIILSDAHGQYIPKLFAEEFLTDEKYKESYDILMDPEHEWYWDEWNTVLMSFEFPDGHELLQNGDLFKINWEGLSKELKRIAEEEGEDEEELMERLTCY